MKTYSFFLSFIFSISSSIPLCLANQEGVTIYFALHGETILNSYGRVQGWSDSPLTERGRDIARCLAVGLQDIPFGSYYSSDTKRQSETMAIMLEQLGKTQEKVRELKGLREIFFGGFEGLALTDMFNVSARELGFSSEEAFYSRMENGDLDISLLIDAIARSDKKQDAEFSAQVKKRTQEALSSIVSNALQEEVNNILVASPGYAMQIMISDLTGNKDKNKPLSNASLIKIKYKSGKYSVLSIGDRSYVMKGKSLLANGE